MQAQKEAVYDIVCYHPSCGLHFLTAVVGRTGSGVFTMLPSAKTKATKACLLKIGEGERLETYGDFWPKSSKSEFGGLGYHCAIQCVFLDQN